MEQFYKIVRQPNGTVYLVNGGGNSSEHGQSNNSQQQQQQQLQTTYAIAAQSEQQPVNSHQIINVGKQLISPAVLEQGQFFIIQEDPNAAYSTIPTTYLLNNEGNITPFVSDNNISYEFVQQSPSTNNATVNKLVTVARPDNVLPQTSFQLKSNKAPIAQTNKRTTVDIPLEGPVTMDRKDHHRKYHSMGATIQGSRKKPVAEASQVERVVTVIQPELASLSERIKKQHEENNKTKSSCEETQQQPQPKPKLSNDEAKLKFNQDSLTEMALVQRQKQSINRILTSSAKPQSHLLVTPQRQQQQPAMARSAPPPVVRAQLPRATIPNVNRPSGTALQQLRRVGEGLRKGNATPQPRQVARPSEDNNARNGCKPMEKTTVVRDTTIYDPTKVYVHHQIKGSTVKMLMVLVTGEQRLITFDVPEECTVADLLEQVDIKFSEKVIVQFVKDHKMGINYIVDASQAPAPITTYTDEEQEDENSNSSCTFQKIDQEKIDGIVALCTHCGIKSEVLNFCCRCNKKIPADARRFSEITSCNAGRQVLLDTTYNSQDKTGGKARLVTAKVKPKARVPPNNSRARARQVPECLIISSDEEDASDGVRSNNRERLATNEASTTEHRTQDAVQSVFCKEPVITLTTPSNPISDNSQFLRDLNGDLIHTELQCRTVRIGSYKYVPPERVVVNSSIVKFMVPLLEDEKNFVSVELKISEIVKTLIHYGKAMPVVFFYTTCRSAANIRELLGMQDPRGSYYDPAGKDVTHKRITLLPEEISDESRTKLRQILDIADRYGELNLKEANDILVRATPKPTTRQINTPMKGLSSTAATPTVARETPQKLTTYPPPPAKSGIPIHVEDYQCLAEDQFLNDVIIDFYLKYLTSEVLSEEDQNRTHVFSTYFYKRLTSPHSQAPVNKELTAAQKRHARVSKWTKNVNIFEKDYIVIPINEHAHWFLAMICFPGLVGKVMSNPTATSSTCKKTTQQQKTASAKSKNVADKVKTTTVTIGSTTISKIQVKPVVETIDDGSERDEAEGDDEEMDMDSDEEEAEEKVKEEIKPEHEINRVPCILIFDSLAGGASRSRVVATLRDYLTCEHKAKMGFDRAFTKDTIKGACPKVPQQSNFTDCGLYVLQYVESFFANPITNFTLPIKTLKEWFEELVVTRKREEIAQLLDKLIKASSQGSNKMVNLPALTFPTVNGVLKEKPEEAKGSTKSEEDMKMDTSESPEGGSCSGESTRQLDSETEMNTTQVVVSKEPLTPEQINQFFTNQNVTKPSSETVSSLKKLRIPRLQTRTPETADRNIKRIKVDHPCK